MSDRPAAIPAQPTGETLRGRVVRVLDRLRLLGPASRLKMRWLALRGRDGAATGPDGLPIPPARLQLKTIGRVDNEYFSHSGAWNAAVLRERAADCGRDVEAMEAVLDFGCGCGRVVRWWRDVSTASINGCDFDPELVAWCDANLPFASFRLNQLEPPLPYEDQSFDLLYSISVFTHLPIALQRDWSQEIRRVLKPGGLALVTLAGDWMAREKLLDREFRRYSDGEPVVLFESMPGGRCAAFHPPDYVSSWLDGEDWRILDHAPGSATADFAQDLWVLERR
jgi:SAM-dependent methyltransferase